MAHNPANDKFINDGKNTTVNQANAAIDVDPQVYSSDAAAVAALGVGFLYLDAQGNVRKSGDGDAVPVNDLGYFGQTNWATNGGDASRNLVPPMIDRLSGAEGRYTVTGLNFNLFDVSSLFNGDVSYPGARGTPNQSPIVEIDFNPSVGWTPDTNTGYDYAVGMLVLHYYYTSTAGHVKVELYKPVGGVDQWSIAFDGNTGGSTQIIQIPPGFTFVKKMRITYSQPEGGTAIWPTNIEYAPWRPSLAYKKDAASQVARVATGTEQYLKIRLPIYADDAAAGAGGLTQYEWYRRSDGALAQKL